MIISRYCLAVIPLLTIPAILPPASAQLQFTQPTAELGNLRGGPIYAHRFEFVNAGKQAIDIADIRLGCGCLQPVLEKRTYRPGEKGTLHFYVRTLGQPDGRRTWQAHILYQQQDKKLETTLALTAAIKNEVTIEPSIVAMTVETTLRQELVVKDSRAKPLKITSVVASSPAVRVSTQPMANGVTKVILEVKGAALTARRQEGTINLYTDDPHYRHLQVPLTLTKALHAEVSATPDKADFTGAGSQLVRLRAPGDGLVRIVKAQADADGITCTWAAGPGNDATLKIASNGKSAASATVSVWLTSPNGAVLTIPVTVTGNDSSKRR